MSLLKFMGQVMCYEIQFIYRAVVFLLVFWYLHGIDSFGKGLFGAFFAEKGGG